MTRCLLVLMSICLLTRVALAQDPLISKIDDLVNAEMQMQRIPGMSIAVVKAGVPILVKGYGLANVEHQVAVKPETIFQSGSIGKQFTAAAVMLLVEDGKIQLDDAIGKYLGDVPDSWANITIRHLLTQTSGFTDYPKDFDFRRDYTEDQLLERIKGVPPAFQPGQRYQYSNLGYVTLGILIGKVTGKFYGNVLQERIFKPLGMTTARIISEFDVVPNRAAGYLLVNGEWKNQTWVSPALNSTADGALYLTVLDMLKWDAALKSDKLLKRSSLDASWTPVKLTDGSLYPYGFGWRLPTVNGRRLVEHGGSWQGFGSQISRFVDDDLTVVIFVNLFGTNRTRLVDGIAQLVNPELKPVR